MSGPAMTAGGSDAWRPADSRRATMGLYQLNSAEANSWPSFVLSLEGERQLAAQQARQAGRGRPAGPLAVSLHAFHLELVPPLLEQLEACGLAEADLWISTDTPAKAEGLAHLLEGRSGWRPEACHIQCLPNRGRNVLPLLRQLQHDLQPYTAVLHLHTKRTEREGLGQAWRDDLLAKLLGSADQVGQALALLADPGVGLVLPCRFAGIDRYYKWGIEFPSARDVLQILVPERQLWPSHLLVFPAGMMFWLRPAALLPLARLYGPEPAWQAFAPEPLPTRGTLAHAIERSLCHLVEAGGCGWRLLDGPPLAAGPAAEPPAPLPTPSVWGGTEMAYFEELAQLTARLQRLERQARQRVAVPAPPPRQRQHWLPWRRPLTLALVLPRAGRGFTSSAYLRWLLPLEPLQRQGACQLLLLNDALDPALGSCDAVVVQRAALASRRQVRDWRQRCQQLGLPLVFDLDDALFALGADHPEAASQRAVVAVIDALMAAADHLIVSTAELRRACLRRLARRGQPQPPVTVIANGLDPQLWGPPDRGAAPPWPPADAALRLLYMGTPTHDADLQPVVEALDQLHHQNPGRLELVLVGGLASGLERDWLTTVPVPLAQRRYPAFVPWLRQLPACHVGLAPLADNPFNRCKSDLKALDYTALGLACLCSDLPPYGDLIRRRLVRPVPADGWRQTLEELRAGEHELARRLPAARRYLWRQRRSDQVGRELLRLLRSLLAANHA
ncbi:MAG: rhamnan synthesis F family protein [Cyanobacteriota bacterium]|nr:rhamnan synthesis F family protein [Cyanobacteriota bacterium]